MHGMQGVEVQIPLAPLLEDIKDPERKARKTLEKLLKLNLITGNLEVRNKVETKCYWIKIWFRNYRTLRTCI